jgi:hypothetical protein
MGREQTAAIARRHARRDFDDRQAGQRGVHLNRFLKIVSCCLGLVTPPGGHVVR